ncbi:MAG: hypothetical protein AAFO82_11345, partial [Bacteroidota bacterium]
MKILKIAFWVLCFIIVLVVIATYLLRPQLNILTGYVAKNVCSCIYVAERPLQQILAEDVGYGLLKYAKVEVNEEQQQVKATVLGLISQTAYFRGKLGCSLNSKADRFKTDIISFPTDTTDKL